MTTMKLSDRAVHAAGVGVLDHLLAGRGVEVSEVFHDAGGIFHHIGAANRVLGAAPENADYGSFASFSDPDGNGWLLQEINTRAPGR
jgi:hypothetical protein